MVKLNQTEISPEIQDIVYTKRIWDIKGYRGYMELNTT